MLVTSTQVLSFCKAFASNSSANIKFSKVQLYKIGQSGGFLDRISEPLLKAGLSLMKNVLKPLAKSILIPLGLTAAAATDAAIHIKMFGSSTKTLIISNEEINDIMKIVKSLGESVLFIKGVRKQFKMKQKSKKDRLFSMLLGTLVASFLGNLLTGKNTVRAGEGTIRASQDF